MNLGEYFALLICHKPLTNLCAFVTLMQLFFPPHSHFLLSYMQCWHGQVIEQNWFLTDKTNLPTHPLQFNHPIFNSIRWPDLGSNDLCNIAVTMHSPFPLFQQLWLSKRKESQHYNYDLINLFFSFQLSLDQNKEKRKKSSTALMLMLCRSKRVVKHNLKIKFNLCQKEWQSLGLGKPEYLA